MPVNQASGADGLTDEETADDLALVIATFGSLAGGCLILQC